MNGNLVGLFDVVVDIGNNEKLRVSKEVTFLYRICARNHQAICTWTSICRSKGVIYAIIQSLCYLAKVCPSNIQGKKQGSDEHSDNCLSSAILLTRQMVSQQRCKNTHKITISQRKHPFWRLRCCSSNRNLAFSA